MKNNDKHLNFMQAALVEAENSYRKGGIPIGSVLVINDEIVSRGHNQRVQKASPILHAEMDCLENAGRLTPAEYRKSTLYTTLSPCDMCSGAILLYKIPTVVIGENKTFQGPENELARRGVEIIQLDLEVAHQMMQTFIKEQPELWNEDISMPHC